MPEGVINSDGLVTPDQPPSIFARLKTVNWTECRLQTGFAFARPTWVLEGRITAHCRSWLLGPVDVWPACLG